MLCANCRKNQATKSYEAVKKGKPCIEYLCLDCYERLFSATQAAQTDTAETCPYCGMTAEKLKKRNLVGCAKCYQTLAPITERMIEKMQSKGLHCGRKPSGDDSERVARRCGELKLLIEKHKREKNFESNHAYTKCLMQLQSGESEEEYVWQKHLILSKKS